MAKHTDDTLKSAIEELRRVYDELDHNFEQVRARGMIFIAAGLTVLGFLYAYHHLTMPYVTYGQVFYGLGTGFTIAGLVLLFMTLRSTTRYYPVDMKDLAKFDFKDNNSFLEYCKEEYITAITNNLTSYESRVGRLNSGLYLLTAGTIILVIVGQF